ncbi:trypsin-like peptidase domain-containing protein [Hyalangium versicolor]|uniref:trypsin-like peptidase domain-containing protein n=1 Tax=Hyalangium versicolor TaxID=2861190 RepID=UPI001CCA4346|nr:trypsin-like peptidase domain-containing protein [Hyalangium versicolor]
MDISNRYASTVMLTADADRVHASCSGILLSQRVALTAASCLCPPRQSAAHGVPDKGPVGPSACAERAFLRTVRYGKVKYAELEEESSEKIFRGFTGEVRVHPEFKLERDGQGAVLTTHADLAIIILDSPVKDELPQVSFSETEVQDNEALVMVGYGDDPRFLGVPGVRYFRHNKVTQPHGTADGRLLYEQQGAFVFNGYTGGPCFREDTNHRWLVGIASVGSDKELAFTSTYFFRDWLHAELQRAASLGSSTAPASKHPR